MRVIGVRPALIGDSVAATVVATYIKRRFGPDAYVNWVVAAKCSQAAPLWINHPDIDRILLSRGEAYEGLEAEVARCGVVFNPLPQHPEGDAWVNQLDRTVYSETWQMAGLHLNEYNALPQHEQVPTLSQWFKVERFAKTIAIWPGSRQGEKENRRNPPWEWWLKLAQRLIEEGYKVLRCGHPNDGGQDQLMGMLDVSKQSFMDLIALSLGCDLAIGTDSGSMLALAAYHSTPTISLLSPHWPGHLPSVNPLAFGPRGKRHVNLWAPSNYDHSIERVLDTVRQLV
jgi:ADP-heptose:LPS heptosyltransferase